MIVGEREPWLTMKGKMIQVASGSQVNGGLEERDRDIR